MSELISETFVPKCAVRCRQLVSKEGPLNGPAEGVGKLFDNIGLHWF